MKSLRVSPVYADLFAPLLDRKTLLLVRIAVLVASLGCSRAGDQASTADLSSRVPDWVPIYPGASPERISSHDAGIEHYFTVWLNTRDDRTEIIEWYENKLHSAGYTTFSRLIDDYGLQSEGPGHTRSIKIDLGTHGDGVEIQIQAVERNVSGGAAPSLPNWVPTYPGTAPGHMEARKSHDEYHLAFSFTSADDPTKIYSWYKTKLEALGFRVSFDVTPHSGGLESNNSDNTRTFNMRNYPGASKNTFTVELMDRPAQ